jgi:hypothetical protein
LELVMESTMTGKTTTKKGATPLKASPEFLRLMGEWSAQGELLAELLTAELALPRQLALIDAPPSPDPRGAYTDAYLGACLEARLAVVTTNNGADD